MKYLPTYLLILVLLVLAGLSAYNYFKQPFFQDTETDSTISQVEKFSPKPTPPPKKDLRSIDKLAQLIAVPIEAEEVASDASESARMLRFIKDFQPGTVVYFGEQISTTSAVLAGQKIVDNFSEADYLPFIGVDHEGGAVQRLSGEGFTKLESWQKIVTSYSSAQQKAVFNQSALELYEAGINIVFGPVVDLASSSAVLKTRATGDLEQTFAATSNFIYSFAQYNIMPVIKHFPGLGSLKQDPHFVAAAVSPSRDDTVIFSRVLDRFSNIGLMSTHVRVTDKFTGQVCSLSVDCVGKLPELYPNVLLFTDDLNMAAAKIAPGSNVVDRSLAEVAVEALKAGNDVLLFGRGVTAEELESVLFALEKEYEDSASFRARVEASLAKVIKLKK